VDENARGRYYEMCSVTSRYKGHKFMEREDPWCEMANLGKPGYTIGVLTNGIAVKPTCVCDVEYLCIDLSSFFLHFQQCMQMLFMFIVMCSNDIYSCYLIN
jgi:hypothetical protein